MFRKKTKIGEMQTEPSKKKKKPFYKKWWFWLLIIFIVAAAASSGGKENQPSDKANTSSETSKSQGAVSSEPSEETPTIELSTEFEKFIWNTAKDHGIELTDITTVGPSEDSPETVIIGTLACPNDEATIKEMLNTISEKIINTPEADSVIFSISDIKDKDNACIATAYVKTDGSNAIESLSLDFNSERNKWIKSQFSAWDGAHIELEKLIKKNLNDEKSYKHIETTYRDIANESAMDEVNKVLAESGYSQRVEVGDLFIQVQFSAKNAFNGTIKNTAFGIASYNSNTITLIDIG